MLRRLAVPFATLALAVLFLSPPPAAAQVLDQGTFKLHLGPQALGAETFEFVAVNDSVIVRARQSLVLPTARGEEKLVKGADIYVNRSDFMLRQYQSNRDFRGKTVIRALILADTHFVAYREGEGLGEADSRTLPAGRLYLMDSQMVTLFDLMCRSLHGQTFDSRPINLLALGPRDTLLEATVVSRGSETIRWGGKPVVARKLEIVADSRTTFTAWIGSRGQLLRLTEPLSGLRVVRDPPPVKRRAASTPPPPKPGG